MYIYSVSTKMYIQFANSNSDFYSIKAFHNKKKNYNKFQKEKKCLYLNLTLF